MLSLLIFASMSACSSTQPYMLPESDLDSKAPGEAFTADSMNIRKPMPDRRESKAWEFYFKHCSRNDNKAFYSKTSYDCSGPY